MADSDRGAPVFEALPKGQISDVRHGHEDGLIAVACVKSYTLEPSDKITTHRIGICSDGSNEN